jgi:hypothetical protein
MPDHAMKSDVPVSSGNEHCGSYERLRCRPLEFEFIVEGYSDAAAICCPVPRVPANLVIAEKGLCASVITD